MAFFIHIMRGSHLPVAGMADAYTEFHQGHEVFLNIYHAAERPCPVTTSLPLNWVWHTGLCTLSTYHGTLRTVPFQLVLTPQGSCPVADLRIGSYVVTPEGQTEKIRAWRMEYVTAPIASLSVKPEHRIPTGSGFVCLPTDQPAKAS